MNKKRLMLIPLLILTLSSMFMIFPQPVLGYVADSYSGDYTVYTPGSTGSSNYPYGSSQSSIYEIDGYIYAWGSGEYFGSYMHHQWHSSGDGGVTWGTASTKKQTEGGRDPWTEFEMTDSYYDAENTLLHNLIIGTSYSGASEVRYDIGTPSSGTVSWGTEIDLASDVAEGGTGSITFMDGNPVVAYAYDVWGGNYELECAFADKYNPSLIGDFTIYSTGIAGLMGGEYEYLVDVHAISSTEVLIILNRINAQAPLYGVICENGVGFGSAFIMSSLSVYSGSDGNGVPITFASTISNNTIFSDAVATEILMVYTDTVMDVWAEMWNVGGATRSESNELDEFDTYAPRFPVTALHKATYWTAIHNMTSATAYDWQIYERSWETLDWGSAQIMRTDQEDTAQTYIQPNLISRTVLSIGLGVIYDVDHTDKFWFFDAEGTAELDEPSLTAYLEDIDENEDWVFTDWKYYTFTLSIDNRWEIHRGGFQECGLRFNVSTGATGPVQCSFNSDSENWTLTTSMQDEDINRFGQPVILQNGGWNNDTVTNITSVGFKIWFNDQCLDEWETAISVLARFVWEDVTKDWYTIASELFFIYSEGGFTKNFEATGTAEIITGGTPFSFYAEEGETIYNEVWFRDAQHVKFLPEIHFLTGYEEFWVRWGMDYSLGDGEWLGGWYVAINPEFVSYTGIFAGNVWINMTVSYWERTGSSAWEDVYMFYHGTVSAPGDPGRWKLWIDLWFSDMNASSVCSGRVNAFEYPMIDNADLWLRWLANNWGVKDNVAKEFTWAGTLYDTDNTTRISSDQISMVRIWSELEVGDLDAGQQITIKNYDILEYTQSHELPLKGISTPVFDETKIPTVGNTGLLGAIFSLFGSLGQWLSENLLFGGLNLWGNFVAFLDTIAGWLGAPSFFSNLFSWIGQGVVYVVDSATYIFQLLTNVFILITDLLTGFILILTELVSSASTTINAMQDIMSGAIGGGVNLWNTLGIWQWIQLAIIFYPLYLIILWDQEGLDPVIKQLTWIFGLGAWLLQFFIGILQFVIGLITGIIESIPVVE